VANRWLSVPRLWASLARRHARRDAGDHLPELQADARGRGRVEKSGDRFAPRPGAERELLASIEAQQLARALPAITPKLWKAILQDPMRSHGAKSGDFYVGAALRMMFDRKEITAILRGGMLVQMIETATLQRAKVIGWRATSRPPKREGQIGYSSFAIVCKRDRRTKPTWEGGQ